MIEWLAKVQQVTGTLNGLMHKAYGKKQRNEVLCTWVFIIKVKSISVHKWITNILSYEHALQYFKSINSFLTFKSGNLVSKIKFL